MKFKSRGAISKAWGRRVANDLDEILHGYRTAIETRINEQIDRHLRVNPSINPHRLVDIQIAQERERLTRLIENEENPANAAILETILEEWLPQFARRLKGKG